MSATLIQQARNIAADQYIRLSMKNLTDLQPFTVWADHIASYVIFMRGGSYDHSHEVQSALCALRSVKP